MIINMRGTSGSGKSTLARRIFGLYADYDSTLIEGRKKAVSLLYHRPIGRPLYVLGSYVTECGGADTLSTNKKRGIIFDRDTVFGMLHRARDSGFDILFEGVIFSDEVRRTVELCKGREHIIIQLDTPLEVCIERIRARRLAKGNEKPLDTYKTTWRYPLIERTCFRLKQAGLNVCKTNADDAFDTIRTALGFNECTS